MSNDKQGGGFSWFVAGLGIGALVGVLYAPKTGREMRDEILTNAREGSDYLRQRSREVADQASTYVDRSKAQVNDYVDRGRDYAERGRGQWNEFVNQGRDIVNEKTAKVTAAVEAGKDVYKNIADTPNTHSEN